MEFRLVIALALCVMGRSEPLVANTRQNLNVVLENDPRGEHNGAFASDESVVDWVMCEDSPKPELVQNMSSDELLEERAVCHVPIVPLHAEPSQRGSWYDSMLSYLPHVDAFSQWSTDYQSLLESSPLVMKTLTAAAVALVGDILAQTVVERRSIDWRRSATLAAESLFVSGPLLHYAYGWMDTLFLEATSWLSSLCQVLIDIFVMDSFFTATAMAVSALLQGQTVRSMVQELRTDYPSAVVAAWASSLSMSPLQFCNFLFIPVQLRVLVTNLQDVVWNAVVSYMAHRNRSTACRAVAA